MARSSPPRPDPEPGTGSDTGPHPGSGDVLDAPTSGLILRRPLVFFLGLLALVVVAVLVEEMMGEHRSRALEPGLGASWIWAEGVADSHRPVAFWIARDLELDAAQVAGARLSVAADEGYVLWIDGRRVGSRAFRAGDGRRTDLYAVEEYLEPGTNRILVELRSSRGAGGFLASLRDAARRPLLVSDGSWRVFRRHHPSLLHGWEGLDELARRLGGEEPVVWGRPPTGRWRVRAARELRPTPTVGLVPPAPIRPLRVGHPSPGSPWTVVDPDLPLYPVGRLSLFDFGRVVEGYLRIGLDPAAAEGSPGAGLLFLSESRPPRAGLESRRPDVVVIPLPGRDRWQDLHPRRFRFAALVGLAPRRWIEVEPVSAEEATAWKPPERRFDGVFGLRPAVGYTPVEERVWDALGGVDRAR